MWLWFNFTPEYMNQLIAFYLLCLSFWMLMPFRNVIKCKMPACFCNSITTEPQGNVSLYKKLWKCWSPKCLIPLLVCNAFTCRSGVICGCFAVMTMYVGVQYVLLYRYQTWIVYTVLMVFMFYSKPLEIPCANTIARIIRPIQMVIDFIMPNQHTLYWV